MRTLFFLLRFVFLDSSTNVVFTTAIDWGNAAQTAFGTRPAAGAESLAISEGAEIGERPISSPPTTP